jgi:hypothetical protein
MFQNAQRSFHNGVGVNFHLTKIPFALPNALLPGLVQRPARFPDNPLSCWRSWKDSLVYDKQLQPCERSTNISALPSGEKNCFQSLLVLISFWDCFLTNLLCDQQNKNPYLRAFLESRARSQIARRTYHGVSKQSWCISHKRQILPPLFRQALLVLLADRP